MVGFSYYKDPNKVPLSSKTPMSEQAHADVRVVRSCQAEVVANLQALSSESCCHHSALCLKPRRIHHLLGGGLWNLEFSRGAPCHWLPGGMTQNRLHRQCSMPASQKYGRMECSSTCSGRAVFNLWPRTAMETHCHAKLLTVGCQAP